MPMTPSFMHGSWLLFIVIVVVVVIVVIAAVLFLMPGSKNKER
jgi:flagellar basal body-associated protein FliL